MAIDFSKFSDADLEAYEKGDHASMSDSALSAVADHEDYMNQVSGKMKQKDKKQAFGLTVPGAVVGGAAVAGLVPRGVQHAVDRLLPEDLRGGFKPHAAPAAAPAFGINPTISPIDSSYHSPFGAGQGAVKNDRHNIDEILKSRASQAALNTPGFNNPGNSFILQPTSLTHQSAPTAPSAAVEPTKKPLGMPQVRAALQSPEIHPAHRKSMAIKGGAAAGFGADAIQKAAQGDIGNATTSALGAGSALGAMSSNPKISGMGKLGLGAAILGKGYQTINNWNKPEQKATGGVVGYAGGNLVKGGLDAIKKLGPAAGNARQLVHPTAEEIAKFVPKPTQQGKFSDFIQNHMGEYLGVHQSDRLGTHGNYMGGTGFPNFQNINPLHAKNEVIWMNNDPNASNKLIKNSKINDKDVIWTNFIGKENQHKSNRGVYNEILADVYKNNPNITEEQALKIADRMRTLTGKDLDIRDKFLMQEIGGDTFDSRGKLSEMFGLGFGRGKDKLVLSPNYQNILDNSAEEFTKGSPTSAIGTRLHRIYDEPSQFSKDFHPDYDYTVHGKDMGVQFQAVPHTLLDWTQKYIKEGRGGKGSAIPHGNAWMNYLSDPQYIDDAFVKRVQAEGFAEGGHIDGYADGSAVKKAVQAGLSALEPRETVKAYKLFKTKQNAPGELFPLFVNANKSVPIGEWVNAEVGPVAASGKVKSKLGELAYRPGWHAGDLPVATHIGGKSDPSLRAPDYRRPDEVWAEVEMPNDVDWQSVANERARLNKAGVPIASTAHITDQVPEGGFYRYKTSPNMKGNWLIGGSMKVNRVLTPEEVQAINEAQGVADLPLYELLKNK